MFDTIDDRVLGINVPDHQPKKGNQWQQLIDDNYHLHYTVVSLGGNDVSNYGDKVKQRRRRAMGNPANETDDNEFLEKEFKLLCGHVDTVFQKLIDTLDGTRIWYM